MVINYDFPLQRGKGGIEDYVHRVGRTGRSGRKGRALLFSRQKRGNRLVHLSNSWKVVQGKKFLQNFMI